jgi:SAM-dependent methyltransferase
VIAKGVRSAQLRMLDALDRVRGRHDPLVPPRRIDFVGPTDFRATGEEFLGHFVTLAGLEPDERVLDIGCGAGRMARPLAGFLQPPGRYEGFDIVPEGISWCRRRYARAHPHFTFRLADVANPLYHPTGRVPARSYRFPYPDGAFDFAFATSVFTHLLEPEARRYLSEAARVLRPGGRVLLTFFLLDAQTEQLGAQRRWAFPFNEPHGAAFTVPGGLPEEAVAYPAAWLQERLAELNLRPDGPIRPGSWSGRGDGLSFQDIVVARAA